MKNYGFMAVITSKHVGQWTVELAKMESGIYEIIMTRVHQITNYVKNGELWLEGVNA